VTTCVNLCRSYEFCHCLQQHKQSPADMRPDHFVLPIETYRLMRDSKFHRHTCSRHPDQPLNLTMLWCKKCKALLCQVCEVEEKCPATGWSSTITRFPCRLNCMTNMHSNKTVWLPTMSTLKGLMTQSMVDTFWRCFPFLKGGNSVFIAAIASDLFPQKEYQSLE